MGNSMNDPTKLAAMAALVGITPETHPFVFYNFAPLDVMFCPEGYLRIPTSENLPALDTPAGDDVFLAPVMRWCCDLTTPHCYFASVEFAPQMGGGWHCHVDAYGPLPSSKREHEAFGESQTAALIRACQSAGVPEIVAIFGE